MPEGKIMHGKKSFYWKINSNSFHHKPCGQSFESPEFSTTFFTSKLKKYQAKWQLELYPKGEVDECKGYVSLFLNNLSENDITVKVTFSLLNETDEAVKVYLMTDTFFGPPNKCWGTTNFINKRFIFDQKNNIIKNGEVTILCEIFMTEENEATYLEAGVDENFQRLQSFDEFEKLLENQDFSDITIKSEGKDFHLHKCVLALRSDVFRAMFTADMQEKVENSVEIKDIRPEVLTEFFRFIYTGKVYYFVPYDLGKLLTAAEKYNVKRLKQYCVRKMCGTMTNGNAAEYLRLAVLNNSEELESYAVNWISSKLGEFLQQPQFKQLALEHPELLLEITKNHFSM